MEIFLADAKLSISGFPPTVGIKRGTYYCRLNPMPK
jgi:hypothetical protein